MMVTVYCEAQGPFISSKDKVIIGKALRRIIVTFPEKRSAQDPTLWGWGLPPVKYSQNLAFQQTLLGDDQEPNHSMRSIFAIIFRAPFLARKYLRV